MKSILRSRLTPILIGLLSLNLYAQTPENGSTAVLTLEEAIRIALDENITVRIADKEIERKKVSKEDVIGALMPNISGSAQYSRTLEKQTMVMSMPGLGSQSIRVGTDNQVVAGFNLSLPVIAPSLWQNVKLSAADIDRSVEAARTSRINMITQVKDAFFNVLLTEKSLEVLLSNYNQTKANYENIANRVDQGLSSEYDMIRSEVQLRNLEPNIAQTETGLSSAYLRLKTLMGISLSEPIKASGDLRTYEQQMYAAALSVDTMNIVENPTLRKLDLEMKYSVQALKLQKMAHMPTLSFSGNYNWMGLSNDDSEIPFKMNPYSTISIALSVPIFDGLSRFKKAEIAKIGIESLKLQINDTERSLRSQIKSYADNMNTSIRQVDSNKKSIELAQRGQKIAEKRYDVGMGSFIELNDANVALLQAQLSYNQAIYNYLAAKNQLDNLLGQENPN